MQPQTLFLVLSQRSEPSLRKTTHLSILCSVVIIVAVIVAERSSAIAQSADERCREDTGGRAAIAACDQALMQDPQDDALFLYRGMHWRKLGELDRAIADLSEFIKLNRNNDVVLVVRGELWLRKREYDNAIADFDRALMLKPGSKSANENLQRAIEEKAKNTTAMPKSSATSGEKIGRGIFTLPDGSRYEGEYRGDQKNGRGTTTWPNGSRYDGEYRDDKPNGVGQYRTESGEIFEGRWINGCFKEGARWASVETTPSDCGFK